MGGRVGSGGGGGGGGGSIPEAFLSHWNGDTVFKKITLKIL